MGNLFHGLKKSLSSSWRLERHADAEAIGYMYAHQIPRLKHVRRAKDNQRKAGNVKIIFWLNFSPFSLRLKSAAAELPESEIINSNIIS
jgi:hypothetical protein